MKKTYIDKIIFHPVPTLDDLPIDNCPSVYSLGYYRGHKRVIIGFFSSKYVATRYYDHYCSEYPEFKFDLLPTLF